LRNILRASDQVPSSSTNKGLREGTSAQLASVQGSKAVTTRSGRANSPGKTT
jgi:hypothetical protein